ncbi:MAG: Mut7-C RNAse domain-containing protein [Elusimicrobiota bacterium]
MTKEPKFLVDFMLGRLAKWLRIFGYDARYMEPPSRSAKIKIAGSDTGRHPAFNKVIVPGFEDGGTREKNNVSPVLESLKENRILLTRNSRLSEKRAWKLVHIKSDRLEEQLKQLVQEFGINISRARLFTRCTVCNSPIERVSDKNEVRQAVPEYVFSTQDNFSKCVKCGKIYWQGTHWDLLLKKLESAGIKIR